MGVVAKEVRRPGGLVLDLVVEEVPVHLDEVDGVPARERVAVLREGVEREGEVGEGARVEVGCGLGGEAPRAYVERALRKRDLPRAEPAVNQASKAIPRPRTGRRTLSLLELKNLVQPTLELQAKARGHVRTRIYARVAQASKPLSRRSAPPLASPGRTRAPFGPHLEVSERVVQR